MTRFDFAVVRRIVIEERAADVAAVDGDGAAGARAGIAVKAQVADVDGAGACGYSRHARLVAGFLRVVSTQGALERVVGIVTVHARPGAIADDLAPGKNGIRKELVRPRAHAND